MKKNQTEFKVGDVLVYPGHGVVEVREVKYVEGMGKMYNLKPRIEEKRLVVISVPTSNRAKLRRVSKPEEIERCFELLRGPGKPKELNWYMDRLANAGKLHEGGLLEVAEVLRDLRSRAKDKPIPTADKKLCERAEKLIVFEAAESKGISEEEAKKQVEECLPAPKISGLDRYGSRRCAKCGLLFDFHYRCPDGHPPESNIIRA